MLSIEERIQALRDYCFDSAPDHVCDSLAPRLDAWQKKIEAGFELDDSEVNKIDDLMNRYNLC